MSKKLTTEDYCRAADFLGCSVAAIKAVAEVESGGRGGFDSQGRVLIRFEGHKFRGYTNGKYDRTHPGVSYRYHKSHRNCGKNHGYGGFNEAFRLDPTAALLSTSYGMFQPMGFNHTDLGYSTVNEMVDDFKKGEGKQLLAFTRLIKKWGLADELRTATLASFTRVALRYNGKSYRDNNYHNKIFNAYKKHKAKNIDCAKVLKEAENKIVEEAEFVDEFEETEEIKNPLDQTEEEEFSDAVDEESQESAGGSIFDNFKDKIAEQTQNIIDEKLSEATDKAAELPGKVLGEKFSFPALIPKFSYKNWLLGLIPGGSFISTILAYAADLPQWFVFLLGAITGIVAWQFFGLVKTFLSKQMDYITKMNDRLADPDSDNPILTTNEDRVGFEAMTKLLGRK